MTHAKISSEGSAFEPFHKPASDDKLPPIKSVVQTRKLAFSNIRKMFSSVFSSQSEKVGYTNHQTKKIES